MIRNLILLTLVLGLVVPALAADPGNAPGKPMLMDPSKATLKAPDVFKAKFDTSKGTFVVEFHRDWSPNGVDRVYNLIKADFFNEARFFRVVSDFVVQFGIPADPAVSRAWMRANIPDDPVKEKNLKGYVTFAKSGAPNSRSTQLFINLSDRNTQLDGMGFAPIGKVVEGMDVVEKLNGKYGESLTQLQGQIYGEGNAFLKMKAPDLDFIKKASIQ